MADSFTLPEGSARESKAARTIAGDIWGGLASTLVALPASIAFGIAVFTPVGLGPGFGALAGLLGAVALGTIAPMLGGTPRLVSAPCAPAVAVMSAFAIQAAFAHPGDAGRVVVQMTLVGLLAAALQIVLGLARAGTVIKYIPYPVVTGYMSGVGVVILLKQLPALLGLAKGVTLGRGIFAPWLWSKPSLVVGAITIFVMVAAPKITKAIPPAIVGVAGGIGAYVVVAMFVPSLRVLSGNGLVIGPLAGSGSFVAGFVARLSSFKGLRVSDLVTVVGPATTLAVVLSLDTLKTCVVVDAVSGSRHDSNKELFGQGVANAVSAAIGGMPGAGTSGPTLVNIASGGKTRWSAVIEGGAVLFAYLALAKVVAWAPLAALAGILVVVAFKMFDFAAFAWARRRSTVFDFVVVLAVIGVAVGIDLITASAVGVALSILLFIRNEAKAPVIRRKLYGNKVFSKCRRLPGAMAALAEHGGETLVVELQGSLFFGTTDQLRDQLQEDLGRCRTIIFDMRRVDALDLTAAHIIEQMQAQLGARGAVAVFCKLPGFLAGQADVAGYMREIGLVSAQAKHTMIFEQLTDALAWAEDRLLAEKGVRDSLHEGPLELVELGMFSGRKQETIDRLRAAIEERTVVANQRVFSKGDTGDEIFFVRSGTVRIALPLEGQSLHIASFGRGDFFGEIAFLDGANRTADAVAETDTQLFILSRREFDAVAKAHPRLGQAIFAGLARALAHRLRHADAELVALEEA